MGLSDATVLELDKLDLHDFKDGQKFLRMARQLQHPERKFLRNLYLKRLKLLESSLP